ncbi:hypothetical protein [Polyangium aurulentum]|uniref:hypothetical protein n=1 Tax=Polyangium aurulentum TaxID=2567896 RepID=UPI00146CE567|nr:hypothetical protein [Polyangium aurulentum]UQA56011.1 hypothetical protein E8A73_032435 [Polyangium aurulentum]
MARGSSRAVARLRRRRLLGVLLAAGAALSTAGCGGEGGGTGGAGGGGTGGTGGTGGAGGEGGAWGPSGSSGPGGGGTGGTGGGPGICVPDTSQPCYEGPPSTLGVGACQSGTQVCNGDGVGYGPCQGQTLPAFGDDCTTPVDENCDGQVNESCACDPGSTMSCYEGPPGTSGVGLCKGGTKTCAPDGVGYGPCAGQVVPTPEACSAAADEDCNGVSELCGGPALWAKRFGDVATQSEPVLAVNSAGDVALFFWGSGSVDFGGGPLVSGAGTSLYLAKLDASGNHVWSKRFGDTGSRTSRKVAMDSAGNVVVVGNMGFSTDFGGGPLPVPGTTAGFVAKFDTAGNHLWSKPLGNVGDTHATSVAIDGAGNVLVLGDFQGSINLGGGMLQSAGGQDLFVAKLDAAGKHVWSKGFGGTGNDLEAGLDVDSNGNLLLVGHSPMGIDFGGGPLQGAGDFDLFVAKLDAAGKHVWSKRFGDNYSQRWFASTTDPAGNVVFIGTFDGTIDLGNGPLTSKGMYATLYVAKLDAAGGHVWTKLLTDGSDLYHPRSLRADGAGNLLMVGNFAAPIDLGSGPIMPMLGTTTPFLAKLTPTGNAVWAKPFGIAKYTVAQQAASDGQGNVFFTAHSEGAIDFGSGPLTSMGKTDVFIAKLAP